MNYFELFGLSQDYNLDTQSLAETYRELQKRFHPDKFANASERDKLLALQKASEINDAFHTLKAPLRRAEYLLALAGLDIRGEQQTLRDPGFLMQQMEWREQLEEIAGSANPDDGIVELQQTLQAEKTALQQTLQQCLAEQAFEQAANAVRKLKFVFKFEDELEQLEESLLE
ncbi:co-chaperone HscB [Motilimonas pumila]|uniref:Co-chaperone protein HscB homolog n=1 Tax=Motilimonas pumila TaxID=2303987 RepID=A0A418YEM9_9GAMM|nr:co-chaperone HscB [Motilimonas pumila]RJG47607.1 co-chaperone HscB [Motilimonas pumila]